jgi:hypothetical protein
MSLGFMPTPFSSFWLDMTTECLLLSVPMNWHFVTHWMWALLGMFFPFSGLLAGGASGLFIL